MFTPRRFYIYIVSAISLQSVTWAVISLLRNLLISKFRPQTTAIAFQISVIVIGLPVFLIHYLWGQRLCKKSSEERGAELRRVYLYGMQAAFLIPFIDSSFALLGTLLMLPSGEVPRKYYPPLSSGDAIVYYFVALIVLSLLWYYHQRTIAEDAVVLPESGVGATVRRLYVMGFSATGLAMTTSSSIYLIRWLMFQIGGGVMSSISRGAGPAYAISRLIIGLMVWLIFWRWAQRLFTGEDEEERESAMRKFYLYSIIFVSVLASVTSATFILQGFFKRLLDLTSTGVSQDDIRVPLSMISGMLVLWAYHAYIIREDTKRVREVPRQARLRRLYLYLVAAIGLTTFLLGLGGVISSLIRSLEQGIIGIDLRLGLTWFTSIIIAGLPVWVVPWRQGQKQSEVKGAEGTGERRSLMRRIYLYFFIFIATMVILSSVVNLVFRFLSTVLGETPPTLGELAQPIAFSLIAIGVLLYHGSSLRNDRQLLLQGQVAHLEGFRLAVVDAGRSDFVQAVIEDLNRSIPDISIFTVDLSGPTAEPDAEGEGEDIVAQLGEAGLIIGPWTIAVAGGEEGAVTPEIAQAVVSSPGRKLLIPTWSEGWEWAGVDRWKREVIVRQTVHAVKQILDGEDVKPAKPLSAVAIIGIVLAVLFLLSVLVPPLFLPSY